MHKSSKGGGEGFPRPGLELGRELGLESPKPILDRASKNLSQYSSCMPLQLGEKSLNGSVEIPHQLSKLDGDRTLFQSNWQNLRLWCCWIGGSLRHLIEAKHGRIQILMHAGLILTVSISTLAFQDTFAISQQDTGQSLPRSGCQDIDECMMSPCDPHLVCTNTPGSFLCSCPEGYHDNGKACIWRPQSRVINILIDTNIVQLSILNSLQEN
ncbi:hypothetical protein C2S53_000807 [Perilla frutescens var. hirtella]|uniref:EGF-like domain-containing protein n=1 Tax=Perilla frutescens var. hirtella TaxID=608512 RepID=A0AAD4IPI1_PERFH|nr:hypothetical protein C2S53_000807 [Perilla frutescens var. hirtella]